MTITYQSQTFHPANIARTYLGMDVRQNVTKQYDVDSDGWSIRETVVDLSGYHMDIQKKVHDLAGLAFNQVLISQK